MPIFLFLWAVQHFCLILRQAETIRLLRLRFMSILLKAFAAKKTDWQI